MMTDPIADMLTRLRNATQALQPEVELPASKIKEEVAKILKEEGFVGEVERLKDTKQGVLKIKLRYTANKKGVITGIRRISKPGLRIYVNHREIPRVLNGMGISILSTPKGVLSDKQCRKQHVGGELLCTVW